MIPKVNPVNKVEKLNLHSDGKNRFKKIKQKKKSGDKHGKS